MLSTGLTIVANAAIATGAARLGPHVLRVKFFLCIIFSFQEVSILLNLPLSAFTLDYCELKIVDKLMKSWFFTFNHHQTQCTCFNQFVLQFTKIRFRNI